MGIAAIKIVKNGSTWRNNKTGKLCTVVSDAWHTETNELFVIYYFGDDDEGTHHARPFALFLEKFTEEK